MSRNYRWSVAILIWMMISPCRTIEQEIFEEGHQRDVKRAIIDNINATNIREYLRKLTQDPHLAGSTYDLSLADYIANLWQEQGLDSVEKVTYSSLLSYADENKPNKVQLINESGHVIFTSKHTEDVLREADAHPHQIPIYNAFSPNGTVEADIVYAHYGRPEDFHKLEQLGVNVSGRIILARYGKIYRGNKVVLAYQHGAIGVILYSDPSEYAQDGVAPNNVYPRSSWMPGTGVQRGSLNPIKGDITTHDHPSIEGIFRTPLEDLSLPKIPCQPIGYDDALHILKYLKKDGYISEYTSVEHVFCLE